MEKEQWQNPDGFYVISGRCPHCNGAISIQTRVEMKRPNKNRVDDETRDKVDALLGTTPDNGIVNQTGVSLSYVRHRRRATKKGRYDKFAELWVKVDPLLGTHKNREIEALTGVSAKQVSMRRFRLKIKLPRAEQLVSTRKRIFQLNELGLNDGEIGRAVRLTRSRVEQVLRGDRPV